MRNKTEFWMLVYKKPKSGRLLQFGGYGRNLTAIKAMADARVTQEYPGKGYQLYGTWELPED